MTTDAVQAALVGHHANTVATILVVCTLAIVLALACWVGWRQARRARTRDEHELDA